jgi:hypothetical protein
LRKILFRRMAGTSPIGGEQLNWVLSHDAISLSQVRLPGCLAAASLVFLRHPIQHGFVASGMGRPHVAMTLHTRQRHMRSRLRAKFSPTTTQCKSSIATSPIAVKQALQSLSEIPREASAPHGAA